MSWKGIKQQLNKADMEAWCEEVGIHWYTINSKGEIDVDRDVSLMYRKFKELPYKFGTINGHFKLAYNPNLISLKNCPNIVVGSFGCEYCSKLDSLEGCPKEVGGNFWCENCKRKFTEKEIKSLCKVECSIYNY